MSKRKFQWYNRFLAGWRAASFRVKMPSADAPTLRAELFGMVQLESYARRLAALHIVDTEPGPDRLLRRVRQNEIVIRDSYRAILEGARAKKHVAPAAEWLLDNYYLIEEQIDLTTAHLPRNYSRQLPRLRTGPYQGLPRVYDLILQLVSHTDGRVDAENLSRFVAAYQSAAPLSLGELWAVPIMLRMTLIEALRRVAYRIAWRRRLRNLAEEWAKRFIRVAREEPRQFIVELAEFVRSDPPEASPFVTELATSLEGQDPSLGLVLNWLEQRFAARGQTLEQIHQAESHEQAAEQASITNTITTLRRMNRIDWKEFVESQSVTETILRRDPADVYARADFATRDRCRHIVEQTARQAKCTEETVAERAVHLAHEQQKAGPVSPRNHVGYYLLGAGLVELEQAIGLRKKLTKRFAQWSMRHATGLYLSAIVLLTAALTCPFALRLLTEEGLQPWAVALGMAMVAIALSRPAIRLCQWVCSLTVPPRTLARLDFSAGIPPESRAAVVVPTLLTGDSVHDLLEQLEIRFLANRDPQLVFGLLTDFPDAPQEKLPGEEALLNAATEGIRLLNAKHASQNGPTFFLLHRPRLWNPSERIWMAYERKRGKIEQFNRLVREGDTSPFSRVEADLRALCSVRFVVTLDTDTQLPPGSVAKLVGTMAHPLNRPRLNPVTRCVAEGYGILQPRLAIDLSSARCSRYATTLAGEVGLDPYTREVSDFYHDLFGHGQFFGKGIYDVEAFDAALRDRFPANRILSHDLIESCYARCGFVSDVEFNEDHPASYLADTRRRHRWVRGDWQIARWLWPRVPSGAARRVSNPLSLLSRWMLFDNLRRSLVPLTLMLSFGIGWIVFPRETPSWTGWLLVLYFLPEMASTVRSLAAKGHPVLWRDHVRHAGRAEARAWAATLIELVALPYDACLYVDAILRSLWRLWISRLGLLKWRTAAAAAERVSDGSLGQMLGATAAVPLLVAGMGVLATAVGCTPSAGLMVLLALWFCGPVMLWFLGRRKPSRMTRLTVGEEHEIGTLAFRTWMYFERFAGPEHNWLPPDNVQQTDGDLEAPRTSPTNIALGLLSNLAACDLGFLCVGDVLDRIALTFTTLEKLDRYQGHFYNWYDTRSLQPLYPRYVSSVDSGNLLAALVTLRAGLLEWADLSPLPLRRPQGFAQLLNVALTEAFAGDEAHHEKRDAALEAKLAAVRALPERFEKITATTAETGHLLEAGHHAFAALKNEPGLTETARNWLSVAENHVELELREFRYWTPAKGSIGTMNQRTAERREMIRQLADRCEELADMDMGLLYDPAVHLFHIGYNAETREIDPSYYDMLASEARMGSYVAVARGLVPVEHWFHMGRHLAPGAGAPVLLSWSGSMFEYLMPELLMPLFEGTLLGESARGVVVRQQAYGASRGTPWGISESGYNQTDAQGTYQYHAFGVPGLGLKRGLGDDLVVAPYATALALTVDASAAAANLRRLVREGALGTFGLYEALDYTPERIPVGQKAGIVRSYMAHHSGMSLLAFADVLCGQPMRRRFRADLEMRANEMLLQERIPPARTRVGTETARSPETQRSSAPDEDVTRRLETAATLNPEVHLLSNGRYHVMVTNAGGGYSRWQNLALTRWREDATRDHWGSFFYLRDAVTGDIWSATHQPVGGPFDRYEVNYFKGAAEFCAVRNGIQTLVRVAVSAEDDLELRRLTITNLSARPRTLEVTSYAEVVLAEPAGDATHPVFSGLFIEAEVAPEKCAILFTRRSRSDTENWPCLFHLVVQRDTEAKAPSFQTSRESFIGRGRTTKRPAAVESGGDLQANIGAPLDPIAAIRHRVTLQPGGTVTLDAAYGVGDTRETAASLVDKYMDSRIAERVFAVAWTHNQVLLYQLKASEADAQLFGRLAGSLLYANRRYRANPSLIARNRKGQSALWSYAVSGDRPILLLRVSEEANMGLVRRLIQAHSYWKYKGLEVDFVIWAEAFAGYRQSLFDLIMAAIHSGTEAKLLDQPGGIFVRNIDQVAEEDRVLFQAVARVFISDRAGTLESQVERQRRGVLLPPLLRPTRTPERVRKSEATLPARALVFGNGFGGFTEDGREYVILMPPGVVTPAPWANVLANPSGFGTVITESGASYTWAENAHELRLTPWYNDPVSDPSGEAFFIRDEETGAFWSPTPKPANGLTPYVCRHGHGYTVYEHTEQRIASEMQVFVAADAPVKCALITLRNLSDRPRRISVTGYCEWVLGERREQQAMHIVTRLDAQTGALFAGNVFNTSFPDRVAFFQCSETNRTFTCDRTEFLGRNGSVSSPVAMRRESLANAVGAGFDPCAAIQGELSIPAQEERRIVFVLGCARGDDEARGLLHRFGGCDGTRQALEGVWEFWKRQLGGVYVETPDRAVDFLVNHWLLYQILTARFWGRSGFYQSGGAYGFRDQLQDSLAFLYECPWLARPHLLLCAARQFPQGDVQHWWHPPSGRGVRTRISDTALWLPYAVSRYVETTGDTGVLDEHIPFLEGRALGPEEESYYDVPFVSEQSATLYEHCVRAIRHSLQLGRHGLPLMGTGDWNDGMNRVGQGGKGESVWLGFFLHDVLMRFSTLAEARDDAAFARECRDRTLGLAQAVEAGAWDGKWYKRAYFDDGRPLGSANNDECRIDSLPQSWSVLSGAGTPEHRALALRSAGDLLVDHELHAVRLFTPPFDTGLHQPGYIRGYVPGVRENGGQYTHAAVWLALAFAEMKDAEEAWRLVSFLNPIRHGDSAEAIGRYRVEPYVLAGDVYTAKGHEGRGGWTWYTGSAGWMYQLLIGHLLGLHVRKDKLMIEPVLNPEWPEYTVHYRYRNTFYHIRVSRRGSHPLTAVRVVVDGAEQPDRIIHLVDDGQERSVEVEIG